MSRLISDILEAKEPEFSHNLKEWERLANFPAVDIRMTLEMKRDIKHLLGELGLDQDDTTGSELYHSLIKRYNQDNNNIR